MTYRMAICMAILFPVLCNAAESDGSAADIQSQATIGSSENPSAAAQPGTKKYEKLIKELTTQPGAEKYQNLLNIFTAQSGIQQYESLVKALSIQSSVQQYESLAGRLFKPTGLERSDTQIDTKSAQQENEIAWFQLYESQKSNTMFILAALVGAWFWNKFLRLRCPSCRTARPLLVRIEEADSWLTPKMVNERRSVNRSKPRTTSFTKVRRVYMCKPCGKRWEVVSNT